MLKVGLIGCGFMGAMHANCYKNIEGVELVALADIRPEKAQELAAGTNALLYGDGHELIEKADVDIIDICLPTYMHAEFAMAAMDKVKYVFVEKPVALTNEQASAMIEKAEATGCNVQVGQVIRFWDEYVELKKILESGKYGSVVNANFRRISPRPTWGWEDWLLNTPLSGGAGTDLHVHDIDYVLSLFGEPNSFHSVKNIKGEQNSYVNTIMQYEDFVVGVEGTWGLPVSHPFEATFRVVFEGAVIENAGGKFMCYTEDGAEEIVIQKKELAGNVSGGNISDLGGYYNELVYFTDRAKNREKIENATLSDAAASLGFVIKELSSRA
ncbi:MAG: Gfo/Idh/MocA family oxidoreductase [Ruminococcaceae bacterium]|nr:Gfo/Idh/MocA family oxidoreductase [Oscillospiraceae bacterium]